LVLFFTRYQNRQNGDMTNQTICQFWVGLLSLLLSFSPPGLSTPLPGAIAETIAYDLRQQQAIAAPQLLKQLAQTQIVYLGETHDRAVDHAAQLQILKELQQQQPKLIIAMEMFQRPMQSLLDRYLRGELSETALVERSEYRTRWGFPWEFYAPILRFAKAQKLPVIALNTPTEVTRKVARSGLSSLNRVERRFIPPLSAIALAPASYRQRLYAIFEAAHQGKTSSLNFDYFFQAQVLWDETMAERLAQAHRQQPSALIVVLVGQAHLFYGEGIPQRVTRRSPNIQQAVVLLNPEAEIQTELQPPIADYFWVTGVEAGSK
jgi:uncharacterized iron-regulated protein